jgi:ribonucleoside-diphosphate reductase alpha chain
MAGEGMTTGNGQARATALSTSAAGGGLRLERVWTTEGTHPYDEVTWERRDVVMTNWRDGSVNFEQRGVEFPDFWSVNAANIVTTKYFRGAVGTPEREWSLKQLIDRVVKTYRAAGERHGYFATPADAEVFEHELTWMLLHQVFSFNSPVWFNVGTSSKAQVSACLPYDAMVSTPAGLVPIGKLVEDDAVGAKVFDAHGLTKIVATRANGVRDVLRLHTKAGYPLDVTADHLVWKSTGDKTGRFVEAGTLLPGDKLEWHRRSAYGEEPFELRDVYEAALAGWLQSDGFVGQYEDTNRSLTIEAMTVNDDELDWVVTALDEVFPGAHRHEREVATLDSGLDCRRTRLYGEHLRPFVGKWGLSARGIDMAVPAHLFTAPLPVVAAYLKSVFQAEGYVSAPESSTLVALDMISEKLVRGMQSLLLRFGIFSRVSYKPDPRENRHGCWSLRIQNDGDREIFADEIGFVDGVKSDKLAQGFRKTGRAANPTKRLEIAKVEHLGPMEVYDIQTESGEFLAGSLRVHNCFILAVDDSMDSILDWYKEEGLIFKGGSGSGVNLSRIRSAKELLSSGGTASGPVSFMRGADASAGTIKSGGATRRAAKMVILDVDHPDIEEFIETKAREEDKIRALRDAGFDMDLGGRDIVSVQYQNANNSVRVSDEFMRAVENGEKFELRARLDGSVVETVEAKALFRKMAQAAWECADPGLQYDDTINDWHTNPETGRITASNPCSEYLSLDNSSCNLASLNLLKFLRTDGTFEVEKFVRSVEFVITAMDVSICFADFPTQKIAETTRAYRQLGIGYANLGALLMASGLPYDSAGGRSVAAAITSLMTATAYRRSAELARVVGAYDGYARNAEAHKRVMRKHAAANDEIRQAGAVATAIQREATRQWQQGNQLGERHGWRNAQASLLAPTGCLTPDTLVTSDRGLVRLGELGDRYGDRWQDVDLTVSTDDGPRRATKFFVNGEEPTRRLVTTAGYRIQGTLTHRVKVVDPQNGDWVWKRMADVQLGDVVPVQLGTLVGEPRRVPLPVLDQAYYAGDRDLHAPDSVDGELAELVGYFMGDGSLHAKGIRLCVADADLDVLERLRVLSKGLFGLEPVVVAKQGYQEVTLQSVRLARWWRAAGFAKTMPHDDHVGKGWVPRVPSAILETNDVAVYGAFLRGLFEADGTVLDGVPSISTATESFADEIRTLMLAMGMATTTRQTVSGFGGAIYQVRLRNQEHAIAFDEIVGFIGDRKANLVVADLGRTGRRDRVYLPRGLWDELVPVGHELRGAAVQSLRKHGGVARGLAMAIFAETRDERLGHALGYLYETVAANEDGGVQPTFDLSVPENVTYVANGFVSHNTIGLAMDCDTTGVEPDLALVKFKKLVGGGSMQIVNQTVPRALRTLGYQEERIEAVVEYIAEHGHVVDAPGLKTEHYPVFDCAMGERSIAPMGHVRMMAALQPFLSGAISKCVVGDTLVATGDGLIRIGSLHRGEAEDTFRGERIEITSLDRYRKTDAFYYGGVRPVRRLRLRSGHTVTGTYPHRLLIAGDAGLVWKTLGEIEEGDAVAVQYGAELWSPVPASLRDVAVTAPYGNQKAVRLPEEMTDELAFLLGAYAAEGHTTRSTWTVTITNSVPEILVRVRDAWRSEFGLAARIVEQPGKSPSVVVSAKAVVEFLDALGCGSRASDKRIPDAVLRSPRSMVLAFLQGLALDAYVTTSTAPKWAICLDSPELLDDLQAVLTNLGVRHGRVTKFNRTYGKSFDEVYAAGRQGQLMASLVPFLEPDKAARAAELLQQRHSTAGTADVVPGITGGELFELIPADDHSRFRFLLDARTQQVTRETVERVASLPGVDLPEWLRQVIDGNLHFSPVSSVEDAGEAEVYDLSVPVTHAFVANGIMNHNTVNMPESATVEDVEGIYFEGWKLGLKALAIYRDNCKVGQPLSAAKKPAEKAEPEKVVEYRPVRKRLPKKRPSSTVSFSVAGAEGYLTASSYPDDGIGEVFLKLGKQGSTLAGVMDAFSVAVSVALQYGVPLETYVEKFMNMRFEPAGLTDDSDIRMAVSVMDYIFRRLALDYLPYERRAELGIFTAAERAAQIRAEAGGDESGMDLTAMASSAPIETARPAGSDTTGSDTTGGGDARAGGDSTAGGAATAGEPAVAGEASLAATARPAGAAHSSTELVETVIGKAADAPLCFTCGTKMRPAGSCYVCEGCGSTSGCS